MPGRHWREVELWLYPSTTLALKGVGGGWGGVITTPWPLCPPIRRPSSRCTEALKHKTNLNVCALETSRKCFQAVLVFNHIGPFIGQFALDPLTPNDHYRGRTAPLTSLNVAFYIFIQQIQVLNILNMVYTLRYFLFKMQFVS